MNKRFECKKLINQIWDLNKLEDRIKYGTWMKHHIGKLFRDVNSNKDYDVLISILKFKIEHGHCPIHKEKRHHHVRRNLLGANWETVRKQAIEFYGNTCNHCGKKDLTGNDLTVDHIIPLFSGGKSEMNNLQILCADCHKIKGKKNQESKKALKKYREEELPRVLEEIRDYSKSLLTS